MEYVCVQVVKRWLVGVCFAVAYCVEGRSREQCAKRWQQLFPTNIIRGRWRDHEDAVSLIYSVSVHFDNHFYRWT